MGKYVGASIKRREDPDLLTAKARYISDIAPPGTLYAGFVRSTYAHALIKRIDLDVAKHHPDFVYALTGEDAVKTLPNPVWGIANQPNIRKYTQYLLAWKKVRYVGEPIVVIVARNRYSLDDIIELVNVEYELLPTVTDPEEALKPSAPIIHEGWPDNIIWPDPYKIFSYGDIDKAFREADLIVDEKIDMSRVHQAPMETRAIVANYDSMTGEIVVWAGTQANAPMRTTIARYLDIPESKVRVISKWIGGGFGMKIGYADEVVVCFLSKVLRQPVKWVETRTEDMISSSPARAKRYYIKGAFKKDGKLLGVKLKLFYNSGAYANNGFGTGPAVWAMRFTAGAYEMDAYSADLVCVCTNTTPTGAYRGYGMLPGAIAIERVMDIASQKLGIDPVAIRLKNVVRKSKLPYVNVTGMRFDASSFEESVAKAAQLVEFHRWKEEAQRLSEKGRYIGVGLGNFIESSGGDERYTVGFPGWETCKVRLQETGKIYVAHGCVPHGQGGDTAIAQMVADELGVDIGDIEVASCDTDVALGLGTWGSRTVCAGGGAALAATKKLKDKILQIAAFGLDTSPENVTLEGRRCFRRDKPSSEISLQDIITRAYSMIGLPPGMDPTLEFTAYWNPPFINTPDDHDRMNQSPSWGTGTAAALVEIDPESYAIKILKAVIVHDCGTQVNPMMVEGQLHGASAQAIGHALFEELAYGKDGHPLNSTFMDYLLPTSLDIPNFECHSIVTPSKAIPGGFKGVGEMMAICPAILNAINDALLPLGIKLNDTPITPDRIATAMKNVGKKKHEAAEKQTPYLTH